MRRRGQPYEFQALADYNAEVARGIVHTPEYDVKMRVQQILFDAKMRAEARAKGWKTVEAWAWETAYKKDDQ